MPDFLHLCWGITLGSSCLHGKHFTSWAPLEPRGILLISGPPPASTPPAWAPWVRPGASYCTSCALCRPPLTLLYHPPSRPAPSLSDSMMASSHVPVSLDSDVTKQLDHRIPLITMSSCCLHQEVFGDYHAWSGPGRWWS